MTAPRDPGAAAAPAGIIDILADDAPEIVLDAALCKRCGICAAVCPADVFEPDPGGLPRVIHPRLCIWCDRCEIYCPDYAIRLRGRRGW
jgi:NAD-dependent dihydropyrimidine dehydrogenase PreA subunit